MCVLEMGIARRTNGQARGEGFGSRHYQFALTQIFDVLKYDAAVVLEEDLALSPDFLAYMVARDARTQLVRRRGVRQVCSIHHGK